MATNQAAGTVANLTAAAGLTAVGPGPWISRTMTDCSVQILVQSPAGAPVQVDAVVKVEVSNGPSSGQIAVATPAATATLSGNPRDADGFLMVDANWRWIRLNVTFISGVGAYVTGLMGA